MRLIYTATGKPVAVGDTVTFASTKLVIGMMPKPTTPDFEGRVYMHVPGDDTRINMTNANVSAIGARWIEREDRPLTTHADAYDEFRVLYLEAAGRQDVPAPAPADAWRDFIDTAIAQGRAPATAAQWPVPTLTA